jgi:hypothetical protein
MPANTLNFLRLFKSGSFLWVNKSDLSRSTYFRATMIDCSTFLFLNRLIIVRSSGGESPQTNLAVVDSTTYEERAQIQAPAGPAYLHASFRLLASASVLPCSFPLLHFQYEGVLSRVWPSTPTDQFLGQAPLFFYPGLACFGASGCNAYRAMHIVQCISCNAYRSVN